MGRKEWGHFELCRPGFLEGEPHGWCRVPFVIVSLVMRALEMDVFLLIDLFIFNLNFTSLPYRAILVSGVEFSASSFTYNIRRSSEQGDGHP